MTKLADTGTSSKLVGATEIPLISIRPRTTYRGQTNRTLHVPRGYNFYGDNPVRVRVLYKPTLTGAVWIPCGNPVTAGSFDVGEWYVIVSVGTTDFTLIGAASNTIGVSFKAIGTGTGTGTAVDEHSSMEYDISATVVSGGSLIESNPFATSKNNPNTANGILGKSILTLSRTGTSDILTITGVRLGAASSNSYASITWKEIR